MKIRIFTAMFRFPNHIYPEIESTWPTTNIRGHKGQDSTGTRCCGILVLESQCCGFLVLKSRCCGLFFSVSRCHSVLVPESRCHGFLVLESWCCGICASTALFSFLLNLLYHIINVDMWVVNSRKLFCIS